MPGNRLTLLCCLEGSTPEDRYLHQAKDIVVAPGEPFCTAKGSYFVLSVSCLPLGRPDGRGGSDREARFHD